MQFIPQGVSTFLDIFETNREAIGSFKGCVRVQLLQDTTDKNSFSTLSHWDSAENLEAYRQSALFKQVWSQVKPLFSERPHAYSLEEVPSKQ